jgi:hypothetical protein
VTGGSIELRGLTNRFGEIAVGNVDLTVAPAATEEPLIAS